MTGEIFGDEIWMRPEAEKKRVVASEKAVRQVTGDKTKELGVFTIGLGIINAALFIAASVILQSPGADLSKFVTFAVVVLTPSLILVLTGAYVLFGRTKLSVNLAKSIVTLAFFGQALLIWNPINWLFSARCLYLVWRTAGQATQQLNRSRQITKQ
jgi:hypothetical protein